MITPPSLIHELSPLTVPDHYTAHHPDCYFRYSPNSDRNRLPQDQYFDRNAQSHWHFKGLRFLFGYNHSQRQREASVW